LPQGTSAAAADEKELLLQSYSPAAPGIWTITLIQTRVSNHLTGHIFKKETLFVIALFLNRNYKLGMLKQFDL